MAREENLTRAEEILSEANRFERRGSDLLAKWDYHGAVEAAQHGIELAIKSMYHLVGVNPPKPKSHDSGVALEHVIKKIEFSETNRYLRKDLVRMRFISTMWAWTHSTSMYGWLDLSASQVFEKKDATVILDYVSEVLSTSKIILDLVRFNQIQIKA